MEGLVELAEEILHMPVRIGYPDLAEGLADVARNPVYATGVGLLHFAGQSAHERVSDTLSTSGVALWQRIRSWFQGNF